MEKEIDRERTSVMRFAKFFKSYGVALGTVLAAVPVLTRQLDVFPAFASIRGSVSATASIGSLLAIGFLFGVRRWIGGKVFPSSRSLTRLQMHERTFYLIGIPACLIGSSLLAMLSYLSVVQASLTTAVLSQSYLTENKERSVYDVLETEERATGYLFGDTIDEMEVVAVSAELGWTQILAGGVWQWLFSDNRSRTIETIAPEAVDVTMERTPFIVVPNRHWLFFLYVLMFLAAVAAFVWMGLVEYLREELGLTDRELLERPYGSKLTLDFKEPSTALVETLGKNGKLIRVPLYYSVEYDPKRTGADLAPVGPFCSDHGSPLVYCYPSDRDGRDGQFMWLCVFGQNDDKSPKQHELFLPYDRFDAARAATVAARAAIDGLERAKRAPQT